MRLRNDPDGNSAGLWLDGPVAENRGFLGVLNENTIGLYGASAGWSFLMDVNDGAIMIGTAQKAAGYKVNVAGKIVAEEVRVQLRAAWPDYVFEKQYELRTIAEFEKYIHLNKHLPGIQPATEIKKDGFELGDMNKKLLEKIEELSLYIIQLNKRMEKLENK